MVAAEVIAVAASLIPSGGCGATVMAAANVGEFAILEMVYGYSRKLEQEADPTGAEQLQERRRRPGADGPDLRDSGRKLEPEPVPEISGTIHLKDRIAYLKQLAGRREAARGQRPALHRLDAPPDPAEHPVDLDSRRFRSALAAARRLAAADPNDATAFYWVGECATVPSARASRG